MSEMYDKLSATFPNVHKKPGTGQEYITGEQVASRLNEVLGWDRWSFRIVEHGYNEAADELWALGELVVNADSGHVIRQQFGSQKPNRYTKNNAIIDFGFDLKGACTDALKKCATLIGVGLYLLEKDTPGERQQVGATSAAKERPANAPAAAPPKRKLSEITAQMGYAWDYVLAFSQRHFENREPNKLNADEVRRLVLLLEEEKKKEPVHA